MTMPGNRCVPTLQKTYDMLKASIAVLFQAMMTLYASGEQLYLNARSGNDANAGTKEQPLKTIGEAARRINADDKAGATTVVLSEGVYPLMETALFRNDKYTAKDRLVIRAEILPDDTGWTPQHMPVIVTVAPMTFTPSDGEEARGLEIEASHVTIEGLRFSGSPVYYYIDGKQNRRYYPIWRDGKALDDLLVTQCLFAGDVDVLPIRVAVIANGHGLVLDHCVFYHCQNPVVFWEAEGGESHGNAMRNCLVYGCYYSGVWTTKSTGDDFEFHHNIIAGSNTGWISEGTHHYQQHDCIFMQTTGTIEIEKDQGKNNYLQLKKGSPGVDLKAGLFRE